MEKQNGTNTVPMTGKAEQTAKENATKFKLPVQRSVELIATAFATAHGKRCQANRRATKEMAHDLYVAVTNAAAGWEQADLDKFMEAAEADGRLSNTELDIVVDILNVMSYREAVGIPVDPKDTGEYTEVEWPDGMDQQKCEEALVNVEAGYPYCCDVLDVLFHNANVKVSTTVGDVKSVYLGDLALGLVNELAAAGIIETAEDETKPFSLADECPMLCNLLSLRHCIKDGTTVYDEDAATEVNLTYLLEQADTEVAKLVGRLMVLERQGKKTSTEK